MMHKKEGTVFFVIMILLMTFSVILCSFMRSVSYGMSLAIEREKTEKTYYVAYSLYQFLTTQKGILDGQVENGKVAYSGFWPISTSPYKARAWIESSKTAKNLVIRVKKNEEKALLLSFPL